MKNRKRIISFLISGFFLGVFLVCLLKEDNTFSVAERRPLKEFPSITVTKLKSGRFMEEFEDYVLDQFPLRDGFRTIKAFLEQNLFQKKNNNDIYVEQGYAAQMVYPLNETSVKNAVKTFREIYDAYLKDSGSNLYLACMYCICD